LEKVFLNHSNKNVHSNLIVLQLTSPPSMVDGRHQSIPCKEVKTFSIKSIQFERSLIVAKKLSITDILAQKESLKKKEPKHATLYVPSLDAEITIQEPTRAQLIEIKDMKDDGNDYLVYQCVVAPNFKENRTQLMQEFGCSEPHEIVQYVFGVMETAEIAEKILTLAGFTKNGAGVKVVEEIKK
jgi:hypothetical protein